MNKAKPKRKTKPKQAKRKATTARSKQRPATKPARSQPKTPRALKATRRPVNALQFVGLPSKPVAVNQAVAHQLEQERRWPPRELDKTMGADYRYSQQTLNGFLYAVRLLLAGAAPPYRFEYDQQFVLAALAMTVPILCAAINARTQ